MGEVASSGQLRMAFVRWALLTVPLVIFLGFLASSLSGLGAQSRWYAALAKPALVPPNWAFPVAWTFLYALMGVALAMLLNARGARGRGYALALFVIQLALNLAWSPLFFGGHKVTVALALLVGMFIASLAATIAMARVRPIAAMLMLPYLAWLCFAGYLNFEIDRLNPDAETLVPAPASTQIQIRR